MTFPKSPLRAQVGPVATSLKASWAERLDRLGRTRESGSVLIEVIVTASVMIIVGLGVFSAIDGASATSGQNRARSIAASFAQEDQERLRSMRPADLANRNETRTRTSDGVSYTVTSRGEPVNESSGTPGCTSAGSSSDLVIKISSTVRWTSMPQGRKPVKLESIAAPPPGTSTPTQGALAIQLNDRAGQPLTDIPVTVTGSSSTTLPSNELGCSFFGFLNAGSYTLTVSKPGTVDHQGNQVVTSTQTVVAGQIKPLAYELDVAGQVNVTFDTKIGTAEPQASDAEYVSAANPGLSIPRVFGTGTAQASISATSLFPFNGGYGFYSGNCAGANPSTYDINYFTNNPGSVQVLPGGSHTVTVREPALNARVVTGSSNTPIPTSTATVKITTTTTGCTGVPQRTFTNQPSTFTTGVPFGDYTVCASYNGRRRILTGVQNRLPAGTAVQTLNTTTSGSSSGSCP